MKLLNALLNEKYARKAAVVLQWACYVVMVFFVLTLVLACLGRQTFALNTGTGFYENAIYAGQDHEWRSRGFTVYSGDDILVTANDGGSNRPGDAYRSFTDVCRPKPADAGHVLAFEPCVCQRLRRGMFLPGKTPATCLGTVCCNCFWRSAFHF